MQVSDLATNIQADCNSAISVSEIINLIGISQRMLIGNANRAFLSKNPISLTVPSGTDIVGLDPTYTNVFAIVECDNTFTPPSATPTENAGVHGVYWFKDGNQTLIQVRPTPTADRYFFVWAYTCPRATVNATDELWIPDEYAFAVLRSKVMSVIEQRIEGAAGDWMRQFNVDRAAWTSYCYRSGRVFDGDCGQLQPGIVM